MPALQRTVYYQRSDCTQLIIINHHNRRKTGRRGTKGRQGFGVHEEVGVSLCLGYGGSWEFAQDLTALEGLFEGQREVGDEESFNTSFA